MYVTPPCTVQSTNLAMYFQFEPKVIMFVTCNHGVL